MPQMTAKKFERIKLDLANVHVVGLSTSPIKPAKLAKSKRQGTRVVLTFEDRDEDGNVIEVGEKIVRLHSKGHCIYRHSTAYWVKQLETLI